MRGQAFTEERLRNGIKYYTANPGNQERFHQTVAKIRGLFGGNRSGKTHAGAAEATFFATHSQRYRSRPIKKDTKILVGSESNEYNRDIIVPKLRRLIPKTLIVKEIRIQRGFVDYWELSNGTTIKFKNYEQEPDKWAGDDYDFVWLDEEPPPEIFKEVLLRTIDRGGEIVITMTPVKGMTFVFTDIFEKDGTQGIKCFLMDMDENPHLTQADKNLVLANLTEEEKKIRKEGKFVALHGLIYPQFKENKHTVDPFDIPQDWRKVVAVDPHLKKPTSVLWAAVAGYDYRGISKGDWVVYRELRRDGIIPDIVASILVASGRERLFARIGDPSLNVKDNITGVSPFDEFASHGFPLMAANKKVEGGIYAIRELLDQEPPGLWVFNTCIGLIWEFRHYVFADLETDPKKSYSEKIKKRDDDYLDCLRYIINSGIGPARIGMSAGTPVYSKTGRFMGVRPNA